MFCLQKKLDIYLIWSLICFFFFLIKVIGFTIEYRNNVIRNFTIILVKYLFEIIRGPIYVIIYCYTNNTMRNFWTIVKCNRQKRTNTSNNTINTNLYKSDKEVALSLSLNEGDNIPEDSNLNSTVY